ncbi:MAG: tetratricopeptide repeat protein [Candidatus Tectomicrobia bacterium]
MAATRRKHLVLSCLCLCGLLSLSFTAYQYYYSQLIATGNQAVREQRFDTQAYAQARRVWLARQDRLLFNQGVLAYKAKNLPRAAESFRATSRQSNDDQLRMRALYNLGMVLLSLDEVKEATELFKEALRLAPSDVDAKFNLERLYHFVLLQSDDHGQASLEQAPGTPKEGDQEQPHAGGKGRSKPDQGI